MNRHHGRIPTFYRKASTIESLIKNSGVELDTRHNFNTLARYSTKGFSPAKLDTQLQLRIGVYDRHKDGRQEALKSAVPPLWVEAATKSRRVITRP